MCNRSQMHRTTGRDAREQNIGDNSYFGDNYYLASVSVAPPTHCVGDDA